MTDLAVSLIMTPELQSDLDNRYTMLAFVMDAYPVVDSPTVAQEAANELKTLKSSLKELDEKKAGFVQPAKTIIANAEALFDPPREALEQAIAHLNARLLEWNEAERKRIEREEQERRERERQERERAEREAAAARAKAEEERRQREEAAKRAEEERQRQEAEARRLREEAERAKGEEKKRLEREAREREAAAKAQAAKEAEERERARQAEEAGERKAQEAQQAAETRIASTTTAAKTKTVGFSQRKNWIAELEGPTATPEQEAASKCATIMKIVEAMLLGEPDGNGGRKSPRSDLIAYLDVNMQAANRLAKAQEANFNIPGMKARNKPVGVSR